MPFNFQPKDYVDHGVHRIQFGEKRPLLEVELNELQQNFLHLNAETVRQHTYSGFLELNSFGGSAPRVASQDISSMFLTEVHDQIDIVNVDGTIIPLRNSQGGGNIQIPLPAPPLTGNARNFVFLEYWMADVMEGQPIYRYGGRDNEVEAYFSNDGRLGIETSRRTQARWRIRVIENISKVLYPNGISDPRVTALGDGELPTEYRFAQVPHDPFLYIAGDGSDESKENLHSHDGYVYGLPLFFITRRNRSGYTKDNPNGAIVYSGLSDRPDKLYADVIAQEDIEDLRHLISFSGFNYENMLSHEFDRFLRAENEKKQLLKTYHGVPKTANNGKTFVASFDGTVIPEVGPAPSFTPSSIQYIPTPTGLGVRFETLYSTTNALTYPLTNEVSTTKGEIHCLLDFDQIPKNNIVGFFSLLTANDVPFLQLFNEGALLGLSVNGATRQILQKQRFEGFHYVSIAWNDKLDGTMGTIGLYIDGQLFETAGYRKSDLLPSKLVMASHVMEDEINRNGVGLLSDFSMSTNYDLTFSHIPKDVQQGMARITPLFTEQRRSYSEAQHVQNTTVYVNPSGNLPMDILTRNVPSGEWAVGNTLTLKGRGGELISGVMDEKAKLVRVLRSVQGETSIEVNDVDGLTTNMTIRFWNMKTSRISTPFTITAINTALRTVTFNGPVTVSDGTYMVKETFTTAIPQVGFKTDTGFQALAGSWTNLGTSQATFTITGTVPVELKTKALTIYYSLNTPSKQPALSNILLDVYEMTINDTIYVPKRSFPIVDDFRDILVDQPIPFGNTYFLESPTLGAIGDFEQSSQSVYTTLGELNGAAVTTEAATPDNLPQRLFSFHLRNIIEAKFGSKLEGVSDVEWLQQYVESIEVTCHGYGRSPSGNKFNLSFYDNELNTWVTYGSHTQGSIQPIQTTLTANTFEKFIQNEVFHFLVSSDEAVSAENTATLYVDYVRIRLSLIGKDDFLLLVPTSDATRRISTGDINNPFKENVQIDVERRDYQVDNLFLLQAKTKTVEMLFRPTTKLYPVSYGSYLPKQSTVQSVEEITILAEEEGFLITDISSESVIDQNNHHWENPLYRVNNDFYSLSGEIGFTSAPFTADSQRVNIGVEITINDIGPTNYFTRQYALLEQNLQAVGIARFLVFHKNELKLWVCSLHPTGKVLDLDKSEVSLLIPLTGNPIVKMSAGVRRSNIIPVAWRNDNNEVRGYFDEDGQFVATYQ